MFIIHQSVDVDNFDKVMYANTIKEEREILDESYGGADKLKKLKLQTQIKEESIWCDDHWQDQEKVAIK